MRSIFKKPFVIFVAFFFLIALILRLWQLDKIPVSLFGDEIDVGLQAYSILTTGKDYMGNNLPVMFHSFSEYRLPMQLYLAVPFIKASGLNEIGVRGAPVLMGFLSIIGLYFLAKEAFGKKAAIIAALFMAFSPWHFMFSRQANDAGILLPFVLFGTYFFVRGVKDYRYLFASAVFFGLAIYSYAIASLFVPLFVVVLALIYRKNILRFSPKKLVLPVIVGILILLPYTFLSLSGRTTQRFSYITVAPKKEVIAEVEARRKWSNAAFSRVFNNKVVVIGERIINNYSKSLSINFLFSEGDPNPRQSVAGYGLFYHFDLLLILLAFWAVAPGFSKLPQEKKNIFLALGLWLILAPIPSDLTQGGGTHASRLILMLPPLILFSAIGLESLLKGTHNVKGKLVMGVFVLLMVFEATKFFQSYFVIWPKESWRAWQSGFKEVGTFLKANSDKYQRVFLNNTYEPMLPRFLFWYGYDMKLFQREFVDDKHILGIYPGFDGFKLGDKFYFGDLKKPIENLALPENLIVASTEKDVTDPYIFDNPRLNLLDIVYSPIKSTIFYIYTGQ